MGRLIATDLTVIRREANADSLRLIKNSARTAMSGVEGRWRSFRSRRCVWSYSYWIWSQGVSNGGLALGQIEKFEISRVSNP
jgi:hypothetical protein